MNNSVCRNSGKGRGVPIRDQGTNTTLSGNIFPNADAPVIMPEVPIACSGDTPTPAAPKNLRMSLVGSAS